jgi:hypothetical protein
MPLLEEFAVARIDQMLQDDRTGETICLVTFNDDLLLDRAIESFGYRRQSPHDQFKAYTILKLFRPHGSSARPDS